MTIELNTRVDRARDKAQELHDILDQDAARLDESSTLKWKTVLANYPDKQDFVNNGLAFHREQYRSTKRTLLGPGVVFGAIGLSSVLVTPLPALGLVGMSAFWNGWFFLGKKQHEQFIKEQSDLFEKNSELFRAVAAEATEISDLLKTTSRDTEISGLQEYSELIDSITDTISQEATTEKSPLINRLEELTFKRDKPQLSPTKNVETQAQDFIRKPRTIE